MRSAILVSAFLTFHLLFVDLTYAQPGVLDGSFGVGGKVSLDFYNENDEAKDVVIQPDGKIIIAGGCNNNFINKFSLIRLNPDGSLDTDFGVGGKVETQFGNSNISLAECVALQTDGKIVVAGSTFVGSYFIMAVARYLPDGQLDGTFSGDGLFSYSLAGSISINSLAIQSDGSILLAGSGGFTGGGTHITVLKLNSNGTLDQSFGDGTGQLTTEIGTSSTALDVIVQTDGKIVVAGLTSDGAYSDVAVVRYLSNGVLDNGFDGDGIRTLSLDAYDDFASGILQLPNGKLLISATSNVDFALARFNSNGSLDNTFSGDGIVETDMDDSFDNLTDLSLDAEGRIVAVGHSSYNLYNMSVLRYLPNGTLDNLFSMDGKTTIDMSGTYDYAYALALQPDGKIVMVGSTDVQGQNDFAIVRLQGECSEASSTQTISICSGETISVGNNTYNATGTYTDLLSLPSGCDSTVTTQLTVIPNINVNQSVTITEGESYSIGNSTYTEEGTYIDVFIAANGCDSIVTTNLSVVTSLESLINGAFLHIWPMPFQHELNVKGLQGGDQIFIIDLSGRIVSGGMDFSGQSRIELSHLSSGAYFLILQRHDERLCFPLMKSE